MPRSAGGQVLDVRVDGSDQLLGPCRSALEAAVDGVGSQLPDEGVQRFACLPIGVQSVNQSFDFRFALAEVGVDPCTVFCSIAVHRPVQQVHTDQRRREMVVARIKLRSCFGGEVAIVAEDVSADDEVPRAKLLAVQESEVGLLRSDIPGFCVG